MCDLSVIQGNQSAYNSAALLFQNKLDSSPLAKTTSVKNNGIHLSNPLPKINSSVQRGASNIRNVRNIGPGSIASEQDESGDLSANTAQQPFTPSEAQQVNSKITELLSGEQFKATEIQRAIEKLHSYPELSNLLTSCETSRSSSQGNGRAVDRYEAFITLAARTLKRMDEQQNERKGEVLKLVGDILKDTKKSGFGDNSHFAGWRSEAIDNKLDKLARALPPEQTSFNGKIANLITECCNAIPDADLRDRLTKDLNTIFRPAIATHEAITNTILGFGSSFGHAALRHIHEPLILDLLKVINAYQKDPSPPPKDDVPEIHKVDNNTPKPPVVDANQPKEVHYHTHIHYHGGADVGTKEIIPEGVARPREQSSSSASVGNISINVNSPDKPQHSEPKSVESNNSKSENHSTQQHQQQNGLFEDTQSTTSSNETKPQKAVITDQQDYAQGKVNLDKLKTRLGSDQNDEIDGLRNDRATDDSDNVSRNNSLNLKKVFPARSESIDDNRTVQPSRAQGKEREISILQSNQQRYSGTTGSSTEIARENQGYDESDKWLREKWANPIYDKRIGRKDPSHLNDMIPAGSSENKVSDWLKSNAMFMQQDKVKNISESFAYAKLSDDESVSSGYDSVFSETSRSNMNSEHNGPRVDQMFNTKDDDALSLFSDISGSGLSQDDRGNENKPDQSIEDQNSASPMTFLEELNQRIEKQRTDKQSNVLLSVDNTNIQRNNDTDSVSGFAGALKFFRERDENDNTPHAIKNPTVGTHQESRIITSVGNSVSQTKDEDIRGKNFLPPS